jgi:serine-type D-Ala-D-Ala carboxypeptidase/endopeptidase
MLAALSAPLFIGGVAIAEDSEKTAPAQFDLQKTKAVLTELIEKTLDESGVPSISIALVRDDKIVWKAAFGYANVRTKTPATPETLYNTASTFKMVTATGIMQLAERGKIKLDHPVNRYLGEYPVQDRMQSEKAVTFTHILSHWSGLTTFPKRGEAAMKSIWSGEMPRPIAQVIPELYSIRPPETKYEYNNYGYGLAGFLLEKISGVEYEKYICEHVLKPIGVATHSPLHPSPEMVEVMALPYEVQKKQPRPAPQVQVDVSPAGNAYLTAEGMARVLGAQVNGGVFQGQRILSEDSVKQMHEPRFGGNYGFGLNVRKLPGRPTMIRHTGRLPGMSSIAMGDTDAHVGVYYMANATDVSFKIADAAIALLRGGPYPPAERQSIKVEPQTLDRYVGSYELGSDVFEITREEGSLFVQKNKNKKSELSAETSTSFFIKGESATVVFETNPAGEIDRMSIHESDWQTKVGKRRK